MTTITELAFADPHLALSVRNFHITDGLSELFDVRVVASHENPDLDLDAIVGRAAAIRLATHDEAQPYAVWSGICAEMEQVRVEESGVSIYELRITPHLWLATQRRNYRIFQHTSAIDIVTSVLGDWAITPALRLDPETLPKHEYRVQFGESDFDFVSRMLEEDGLSYFFEQVDPRGAEKDDERELPSMQMVITEAPGATGRRLEAPVRYLGHQAETSKQPHVRSVRFGRSVRPGRFTVRGYDYRSSPDLRLQAENLSPVERERRYEQYHYRPEAFLEVGDGSSPSEESRPVRREPPPQDREGRQRALEELERERAQTQAQRGGGGLPDRVKVSEEQGSRVARLGLERERCRQRAVAFHTNVLPLSPGVLFQLDGHPRELLSQEHLLVVRRVIDGEADGTWTVESEGAIARDGFRPPLLAAKPRVMGLQSAVVVGPPGEEIFTDPLGRVKVQFHWDRYGNKDAHSSCWIRVSQAWAGAGYGISALPRVGHEVLVDFFDGDPDLPVVVGRAHHRGAMPPDSLPQKKTKTTWRSATSPGAGGFNEISIDDARGEELVHIHAQKNFSRIVQQNEDSTVGGTLSTSVRRDERHNVSGNQLVAVGNDRYVNVTGRLETTARSGSMKVGRSTGITYEDGKLVLSNGSASIVLDGPNVYIDALGSIRQRADRLLSLHGFQVEMQGRPDVLINTGAFTPSEVAPLSGVVRSGDGEGPPRPDQAPPLIRRDIEAAPVRPGREEEAEFDGYAYLRDLARQQGVKLPKKLYLPPEWNEQVQRLGRITHKGQIVRGKLLDKDTYAAMKQRLDDRLAAERERLKKLGTDLHQIFESQRDHVQGAAQALGDRLAAERENLAGMRTELGAIFNGERGNLLESAKALVAVAKEGKDNLLALRSDLTAMLEREKAYFERFKKQWKDAAEQVEEYIGGFKDIIENPKDAVLDIVLGEDKELAKDIHSLADEFGMGDEVADFFGLEEEGMGGIPGGGDAPVRPDVPEVPAAPPEGRPFEKVGHRFHERKRLRLHQQGLAKDPVHLNGTQGLSGEQNGLSGLRGNSAAQARGGSGLSKFGGQQQGLSGKNGLGGAAQGQGGSGLSKFGGQPQGLAGANGKGLAASGSGASGLGKHAASPTSLGGAQGSSLAQVQGAAQGGGLSTSELTGAAAQGQRFDGSHLMGHAVDGASADALSQPGGLSASDLAKHVSSETPSLLQSPGDGQLLVIPGQGAKALDASALSAKVVDAQMAGNPAAKGMAQALSEQGFTVYERSWDDWFGPFVKAAAAQA